MHAREGRPSPPRGPDKASCTEITWVLGDTVGPAELPELHELLVALLRVHRAAVVICDVSAITEPDAGTVDALARLQLAAQRLGSRIQLYRVPGRLADLLAFTGLRDVLPPCAGLAVEPGRQVEQREQPIGVEERVDPPDPAG